MIKHFLEDAGVADPIIGGPMYPCSNPELVAAISNAGGLGIIQPITLTYVNGYELREGIRYIRTLTSKPIGFNALIEKSSSKYEKKMQAWIDIALQEGVRFFITSLGNPTWVIEKVHALGGKVYHDVTTSKWAKIAVDAKADGLIAVNNYAGGHLGTLDSSALYEELLHFKLPIICAGGVSDKATFEQALSLGYAGVQMGTRFIATPECDVSLAYKEAIVRASKKDITTTRRLTGIPVSIMKTNGSNSQPTQLPAFISWVLKFSIFKRAIRLILALISLVKLKKSMHKKEFRDSFWQAGKSVEGIKNITTVKKIIDNLTRDNKK